MPADLEKGFLKLTNVTSAASSPDVQVKTVIRGKGDPGYLLTASKSSCYLIIIKTKVSCVCLLVMISESALSFILPPPSESKDLKPPGQNNNIHALPSFARQGGILTPMTAFGDVLIKRLEESQRFSFSSSFIGHSKKD